MYQTPEKMPNKKKIEIVLIVVGILWGLLFIVNYINYTNSKPLIIALHSKKEYEDGYVEEYVSLGYIYRIYNRNALKKEEFVPFWVGRKSLEAESGLPKVEVIPIEEAPVNAHKQDHFRGLLYYYNKKRELVAVYKCVNSDGNCEKAFAGWDQYNTKNKDPLTKIDDKLHTFTTLYDKYAFIDDSLDQDMEYGDGGYQRIIYLYKFTPGEEEILAQYADIKESVYDTDKEVALGADNQFIVKSSENNKWGVISISEAGTITEEIPFEYESIDYDSDTKYYILCKDDKWSIYDLYFKKTLVSDIETPIYDVWQNNNLSYYYKTGKDRNVSQGTYMVDYKIYRLEDNKPFLDKTRVTQIIERDSYIAYVTQDDSVLHFMDYGKKEQYQVPLAFYEMRHTDMDNPAFVIWKETDRYLTLHVYKGRALGNDYETVIVNIVNWEANEPIEKK